MSPSAASLRRIAARHRLVRLAAVPPLSVVLAACGGTLPAEDVAGRAEDVLEEEVGVRPDITCPDDLAEEVGAETRCAWTAGDDPTESA